MLETKVIELEAISPIHIKGREIDFGLGMVKLRPQDPYAYIIDQAKLVTFLAEKGLVDKYIEEFSDPNNFKAERSKGSPLGNFLKKNLKYLTKEDLVRISSGLTVSRSPVYFIRNGKDQIIIPGSSVKGALRTAVAYHVLKRKKEAESKWFKEEVTNIERKLLSFLKIKDKKKRQKFRESFAEEMIKKIFGPEPNTDLFRALKVFDGLPDRVPEIETVKLLCIDGKGKAYWGSRQRDVQIPCECLPQGTKIKLLLTLDQKVLKEIADSIHVPLPFTTLDELLQIAEEFATLQWSYEKTLWDTVNTGIDVEFLRKFYTKNNGVDLRLGWGTGILGTTVDLLFDEKLRQDIRDMTTPRPGDPAPKSHRVIIRNDIPKLPLGWIKFS